MLQQNKIALTENELKAKLDEYLNDGQPYRVQRFAAAYPEIGTFPLQLEKHGLRH